MGRRAGSLLRCTCRSCGAVDLRTGCNDHHRCDNCIPASTYRAHGAVVKAIKAGTLKPATEHACTDCGKPATEYDHRDYTKPLAVDPVCHSCNLLRGPALRKRAAV